jgi:hypothetical protein
LRTWGTGRGAPAARHGQHRGVWMQLPGAGATRCGGGQTGPLALMEGGGREEGGGRMEQGAAALNFFYLRCTKLIFFSMSIIKKI